MIEMITNVNNTINGIVWGWPALVVKCTKNYIARMLKGEDVKPMLSVFEDV